MKQFTDKAIEILNFNKVQYGDIRIVNTDTEMIGLRNGVLSGIDRKSTTGFGIRVLYNGAWGFASSYELSLNSVEKVAMEAIKIAKASSELKKEDVILAPEDVYVDIWQTPLVIDPFTIPFSEKIGLLKEVDSVLRKKPEIKLALCSMLFIRYDKYLATTEGSFLHQIITQSGVGYQATAVGNNDTQRRSFPFHFSSMGYELIKGIDLVGEAERVRDEAISFFKKNI